MKKFTASRKVEWVQTAGRQSEETSMIMVTLQRIPRVEELDPFADVEKDKDELEENELVLEDCLYTMLSTILKQ